MITIQILGLDQFVVGRYSREATAALAQAFECSEDEISFYAPNSMVFHRGVEQTSWNTVVLIWAPKKYSVVEKLVADVLIKTLSLYSINIDVVFNYFDESSHYSYVNPEYPRFITTNEIRDDVASMEFGDMPDRMEGDIDLEEEEECECGDEHCDHHHHHHEENPDDLFLGDAFEGFESRYEEETKKKKN